MKPHWYLNWKDQTCIIVASGPSIKGIDLSITKGIRCIAINNSWKLVPWADVVYACDYAWWHNNQDALKLACLKVTQDIRAYDVYGIHRVIAERHHENLVLDRPGFVGWGGNSGFHAINLAIHFGVKRIILIGYDMHLNNGTHWHGDHQNGLNNPTQANVARWRKTIDANANTIKKIGVEMINTSLSSALTQYIKMPLEDALQLDGVR